MKYKDPRAAALEALCRFEKDDTFVNIAVPRMAESVEPDRRPFFTALAYGCVERCLTLDYYIGVLTSSAATALKPHTLAALRQGLYQLAFMSTVPPYAAVNATVALAADRGEASFINGVLRAYVRRGGVELPDPERNLPRYLSLKYSIPLGLVKKFVSVFGADRASEMFEIFNSRSPLSLRINTMKTTVDAVAERLDGRPSQIADEGVLVERSVSPTSLEGWKEGLFFVEGEASQLAAALVDAKPGQRVIDVCAAPGGKSLSIGLHMENKGEVIACDLYPNRLGLVEDSAKRLGLGCIKTVARDSKVTEQSWLDSFDRLLCDLPCSGWGVLGGKPDLRYNCLEAADRLPELQLQILEASVGYLKRGGVLLYSTCTLNPAENEGVITEFLGRHPEFTPYDFERGSVRSQNGMATLTPDLHHTDGFFIARFVKK